MISLLVFCVLALLAGTLLGLLFLALMVAWALLGVLWRHAIAVVLIVLLVIWIV